MFNHIDKTRTAALIGTLGSAVAAAITGDYFTAMGLAFAAFSANNIRAKQ